MAKVKEMYQRCYLSEEELIYLGVRKRRSRQLSQSYYDDNDVIKSNRDWNGKYI